MAKKKCPDCKTSRHIRLYRVRMGPGKWQPMVECRNCGLRWKSGKPYLERMERVRKEVKK